MQTLEILIRVPKRGVGVVPGALVPGLFDYGARSPIISRPGDLILFRYGVRSTEILALEPGAQISGI